MRPGWCLAAILTAMSAAHVAATQEAPAFRSDVYVVALELVPGRGRPWGDLASSDFVVMLDKQIPVPVRLVPYPGKPGFYRLTFSPPDSLRDGKKHGVEISHTRTDLPSRTVRTRMKFDQATKQK